MLFRNQQDIIKIISSFKNQDPSIIISNIVNEAAQQGNPIMQNLASLIEKGDTKQIEQVVRNIVSERGLDYDKEFKAFREIFKL